jgi:DNA (cytosine-5)-methyltransferase 1
VKAELVVGSLFSGIGGIDLGLQRAGMEVAWQVEFDPWCRRVLAKHWPDVPRFVDVKEVGAHNLPPVDMLAGGFPCQDISNAGKQAGIQAERSGLWFEFARIIRELRPRYVLVENVGALLVRGMDAVLGELSASGYDAEWECIPAAAVGAPHIRDRVWIVAYPNEQRLEGSGAGQNTEWQTTNGHSGSGCPAPNGYWTTEPDVGRVANGVPKRVDRLRGLGNAVVPQVVEYIGRQILNKEETCQTKTY